MAEYEINEETTAFLQMSFKDEFGVAVIPTSGSYRIDDMTGLTDTITGTEILGDTGFTPDSSKYTITLLSAYNVILDPTNVYEDRQVTIKWFYGGGEGTDVFSYRVRNLNRINF